MIIRPFNDPAAHRRRSARSADGVRCSRELTGLINVQLLGHVPAVIDIAHD